ncbi:ABC transporter permease subunit [Breznakiellaceae bacterium SP9]
MNIIEGFMASAAPLMLASLAALITEFSGVLGVFIEGFMVLGAFFSWVFATRLGVFWGTVCAACLAGIVGWSFAAFVRKSAANPFIAGLALNLAAVGITESLSASWFGTKGVLRDLNVVLPQPVTLPFLGPFLPIVYIAWAGFLLCAIIMGRTSLGLRLKASGLSPEAARERGIHPERYRAGAWACAAFLAALAGAALTFRVGAYAPGSVAGRGWIALASVYLGFRRVWGTAFAALLFSLADRAGIEAQALGSLPSTMLLGIPSALALLLYSVSSFFRKKAGK